MGWLLDRIDARLSGLERDKGAGPVRIAWSIRLASLTMVLAFAYPILSFVGQWIAGAPLRLGSIELAAAGSGSARLFAFTWIVAPLLLFIRASTVSSRWGWALYIFATVVMFGGIRLYERFDVPDALVGALIGAGAFAVAFTVDGAAVLTAAVLVAGAGTIAFADPTALTGPAALAGSVASASAVAVAFAFAATYVARRCGSAFPLVAMQIAFLAALTIVTRRYWHPPIGHEEAAYLFLFLGILPLFNALADFASLGLTRYLLRKGLSGWTVGEALLDLLGGIAIFAALGVGLISYFHWVVPANGLPLLDLSALFDDLDQRREGMWWLAIMMLSTLLPTALHVSVGMLTVLLQYPRWVRRGVIRLLDHGADGVESVAWLGSAAICAMITASLWLPLLLFWKAATANHGWLLDQVIAFFRGYAMWIGAV